MSMLRLSQIGSSMLIAIGICLTGTLAFAQHSEPTEGDDRARAEADTDAKPLQKRVEYALSGYHYTPDKADLDELGPTAEVVEELQRLIRDTDARTSIRTRAATILGQYESVEDLDEFSRTQLQRLVDRADDSELSRTTRDAAELVAQSLMPTVARLSSPDKASAVLEPYLRSDDLQRRLSALHALGRYGGDAGEELLRAFRSDTDLSGDEQRLVRSALSKYIEK